AVHDRTHGPVRLLHREVVPFDHGGQRRPDDLAHRAPPIGSGSVMPRVAKEPLTASRRLASPSPASRRKFASSCGPSGVSTDSGWNWTPSIGSDTWRRPITTPSDGLVAVIWRSAGIVEGSTHREW